MSDFLVDFEAINTFAITFVVFVAVFLGTASVGARSMLRRYLSA